MFKATSHKPIKTPSSRRGIFDVRMLAMGVKMIPPIIMGRVRFHKNFSKPRVSPKVNTAARLMMGSVNSTMPTAGLNLLR